MKLAELIHEYLRLGWQNKEQFEGSKERWKQVYAVLYAHLVRIGKPVKMGHHLFIHVGDEIVNVYINQCLDAHDIEIPEVT